MQQTGWVVETASYGCPKRTPICRKTRWGLTVCCETKYTS
nr:MAG TPA: hypothetical protein [Caudoviricetes sp.]